MLILAEHFSSAIDLRLEFHMTEFSDRNLTFEMLAA